MKKIIFTLFAACFVTALSATTVNYTADDATIFPNPERGFLHQCTRHANGSYNAITNSKKTEIENYMTQDKISLVLVLYYLDEFNNTATLPEAVFTAFEEDMQVLRDYGLKAIFRIAYAENSYGSGDAESAHDAPLYIIKSHLAQYKSHWQANADVIFCFQAGFVGQYGEWYYTENFGNHVSTLNDSCRALLDTALNAIPRDRTLLLRRPMFKMEYLDGVALTAEEAYTGTAKARLGHYNDAFLYNDDNMGTYSSNATKRAAQKALIAQETNYVPLGGETDITEASQAASQASHDSTVAEMSTMHWTFIKNTYSETVTNMWRANGTFDELNRNMGYRFQLVSGTYGNAVTVNDDMSNKLSVNMSIKNVGYAPLYNERHAYIVLKNENATYKLRLAVDPRTWSPNGVTSIVNETVTVPDTVYNGTYDLYLYLPDAYESIANDARYAVRFANTGVWEESTGFNALGAQVTVSGGSDAPEPVDTSIPLPATLDKSNYSACSEDMTWYGANDEYFNIGDGDHENISRWVEWTVRLRYPGKYIVSEIGASPDNGSGGKICHKWKLVLSQTDSVSGYYTDKECSVDGEIEYGTKWDLTSVPASVYTLRVMNVTKWGQPKLKSLTLSYDGNVPSGIEKETEEVETDGQMYDILGRPVDESYRGVIIMRGKKILR